MKIYKYKQINPVISNTAFVHETAVIIGAVTIEEHSSIWPNASIRGDVNSIKIGKYTSIQDNCVLHVTHDGPYTPGGKDLVVKDFVTVGHNVTLHACTINSYSLIGIGSIILDKAIIEENVLVGAGSLVPPGKILEAGHLWLGNPVKKIRKLSQKEIDFFEYSALHYAKLKDNYMRV